MTKKLKIIGPYTPEHPGPFCTRDGRPARVICTDRVANLPLLALIHNGSEEVTYAYLSCGKSRAGYDHDLMNAEEVPVAREFWVNVYNFLPYALLAYNKKEVADNEKHAYTGFLRTIHVREVLPGDGE